jgi:hypothetical protein
MLQVLTLKGLSQEIRVLQDLIVKDIGFVRLHHLRFHLHLLINAPGRHVVSMAVSAEELRNETTGKRQKEGRVGKERGKDLIESKDAFPLQFSGVTFRVQSKSIDCVIKDFIPRQSAPYPGKPGAAYSTLE